MTNNLSTPISLFQSQSQVLPLLDGKKKMQRNSKNPIKIIRLNLKNSNLILDPTLGRSKLDAQRSVRSCDVIMCVDITGEE
jgi:hypothetical protein